MSVQRTLSSANAPFAPASDAYRTLALSVSESAQFLLGEIRLVAPTAFTVFITGETGVGKELVAKAVHGENKRAGRKMVTVNCAAIPSELAEAQFFGHMKGSFTGASSSQTGCFEVADGSSLHLDEVGEMPLHLQSKLLRVLEDRTVVPVGRATAIPVDVRLIFSTNRNLAQMVREGRFRADLYHRLNVYAIRVSPLRARREDIIPIAQYLLRDACNQQYLQEEITLACEAEVWLKEKPWPGNVREMKNLIDTTAARVYAKGRVVIEADDLQAGLDNTSSPDAMTEPRLDEPPSVSRLTESPLLDIAEEELRKGAPLPVIMRKLEGIFVCRVAERSKNGAEAARTLQIDPATLYRKLTIARARKQ